jgi:hypothetical protein
VAVDESNGSDRYEHAEGVVSGEGVVRSNPVLVVVVVVLVEWSLSTVASSSGSSGSWHAAVVL